MAARRGPLLATASQARRVGRTTAHVERAPLSGSRPIYDRARWAGRPAGLLTGEITETIGPKVGPTMGRGKVTLYRTDPVAGTEILSTDPLDVLDVFNSKHDDYPAIPGKPAVIYWDGCYKILDQEC